MTHLDSTHSRFHLRMAAAFLVLYIAAAWVAGILSSQGNDLGTFAALTTGLAAVVRAAHHLGLLRDHTELDLADGGFFEDD